MSNLPEDVEYAVVAIEYAEIATAKTFPTGSSLFVGDTFISSWFGPNGNTTAHVVAEKINAALAERENAQIERVQAPRRALEADAATIAKLSAELADAKSKLYVPGRWRCPKCNFGLSQFKIRASDGAIGASDTPGEKCPNCDTPLWRVTEREAGDELGERAQEYLQRAVAAEALLVAAREALAEAGEALTPFASTSDFRGLSLTCSQADIRRARAAFAKLSATNGARP